MRAFRRSIAAAALAFLSGCGSAADTEQARICRAIVPALNPLGSRIEIIQAAARGSDTIRVDYRARATDGRRDRFAICRFEGGGAASPRRNVLRGVATDEGDLGPVRLHVLKRYWLEGGGGVADPEPVRNAEQAPVLPRGIAIALQHLILALPPVAIYSLLAAAYSLVYGLVGRINLAFGELAAVGGYAAFLGFAVSGSLASAAAALVAILLALLTGAAHGAVAGRLVFAPLMRASGQQVLIGTIALAIMLQEYLRLTQGARLLWVHPIFNTPYAIARSGDFVVTFTPVAMAVASVCLLAGAGLIGLLRLTRFGRAWRACSDDPKAAALFGIDDRRVLLQTFALASMLAGLAGYAVTVYYGAFGYAGGVVLGLKSLFAAIMGGIGSVGGALIGGIVLGCAETLWSALFPIELRDLAVFIALGAFIVLRPGGLFETEESSKAKVTDLPR